jgi:hypothetical protein
MTYNNTTVLLLDHNRNEILVRNDAFLVETTLMARIDCKRLSSVTVLLYNNCELSLLSTIPTTTTTTAKKVLELKEVQWQVTARLADTSSLHHSVSFSMTHQRFRES